MARLPPPFYRWGVPPVPLNTKPCTFAHFDSSYSCCLRNVTFPSQRWQPQQTGTTLEFTCHTQPVLSGMQDSRREARGETIPSLQLWTVAKNSGRVGPINVWDHISFHRLPGFLRVSLKGASSIFHLGSDLNIFGWWFGCLCLTSWETNARPCIDTAVGPSVSGSYPPDSLSECSAGGVAWPNFSTLPALVHGKPPERRSQRVSLLGRVPH